MTQWNSFLHDNARFIYKGDKLRKAWPYLHAGDCVQFPDSDWVAYQLDEYPGTGPSGFDDDVSHLSAVLQDAWRNFHAGEFEQATGLAADCGFLGHAVSNKSTGVYATYLESSEATQQELFLGAVELAEHAIELLPDDANGYYFHAFNLGRYSQSVSIVKALSQGIGGKIHNSLQNTLTLQPEHAEAHTAMGLYHAEIISKVGKTLGKLTYGASISKSLKHFEIALELNSESPIAHIEYANGLYLLYKEDKLEEVTDLYIKATELKARDAMEQLDIAAALAELE